MNIYANNTPTKNKLINDNKSIPLFPKCNAANIKAGPSNTIHLFLVCFNTDIIYPLDNISSPKPTNIKPTNPYNRDIVI